MLKAMTKCDREGVPYMVQHLRFDYGMFRFTVWLFDGRRVWIDATSLLEQLDLSTTYLSKTDMCTAWRHAEDLLTLYYHTLTGSPEQWLHVGRSAYSFLIEKGYVSKPPHMAEVIPIKR